MFTCLYLSLNRKCRCKVWHRWVCWVFFFFPLKSLVGSEQKFKQMKALLIWKCFISQHHNDPQSLVKLPPQPGIAEASGGSKIRSLILCLFDGVSPRRSEVAGFSLFVFTEPPPLCIYYGRKVTHRTRRVAASCPGGLDPRLHPAPHSLILCFQSTGSGCTRAAPDELKSRNLSRLAPKKFAKDQKKNLSRPETRQNQTGESESLSEKQRERAQSECGG